MSTEYISYFSHIAKLSRVANKQTMFLAHILAEMYFDKELKQYIVDMSPIKKDKIMREISPDLESNKRSANANQYINKLKQAGLIRSAGRGAWLVDPMSFGKHRVISHSLRQANATIYQTMVFNKDGVTEVNTKTDPEEGWEEEEEIDISSKQSYLGNNGESRRNTE